ncbi:RING finger protein 141 [Polypterus senegalus]|uniref:RING finger protein 141 n=1 Tax=Polypterus senegalus TaxID=55291 RepID=UPI001964FCED|nr:RING finger protein 141 [Polypterus senegalus]
MMGQQLSSQAHTSINKLPEKVARHAALARESGFLTHEEFLARLAELNEITSQLVAGQVKHLLFEVQPGSDSSALWKVSVKIVCTKINKETGVIEACRIMNLYQFLQLYKDIKSQAAEVLNVRSADQGISTEMASESSCQASMLMGRVKQMTDEEECCICMDGRADLILPCAHSFCQMCIDKWSDRHRSCPICRLQVTSANESWVMSNAPTEEDIATYVLNLTDQTGNPHRP